MKQTQHSKLLELGNSNSEVYYALKWNFLGNDFQGEHIITLQIFWGIYPQIHYVEFGSQPPANLFSIKSMTTLEVQNKITFLCNIAKFSLILNLKPYRFWIVFPPVKRIRAEFCRGKKLTLSFISHSELPVPVPCGSSYYVQRGAWEQLPVLGPHNTDNRTSDST